MRSVLRMRDGCSRAPAATTCRSSMSASPCDRLPDVVRYGPLFRQWVELNAWQEGTWGVQFHEGLRPVGDELVVTHIRNNLFFGSRSRCWSRCIDRVG